MKKLIPILVLVLFISIKLFSQENASVTSNSNPKKIALVIGNGNYLHSVLANPENDARSMKSVLEKLGFEVLKYENLSQNQMKKAIDEFGLKLKNYEVGLFFYAGHGIQTKGYNYLIPVDAELKTEANVEYDCVQADRVLALMEESGAKVKIVILDACRNNPFERSWTRAASGKGLATMNAPGGTLIGYSTAPGNTASDGSGKNSTYTTALLQCILIPNLTITQMFQNVTRIVSQKSEKQQTPWISSSLTGDFYFNTDSSFLITNNQNISLPDKGRKTELTTIKTDRSQDNRNTILISGSTATPFGIKYINCNSIGGYIAFKSDFGIISHENIITAGISKSVGKNTNLYLGAGVDFGAQGSDTILSKNSKGIAAETGSIIKIGKFALDLGIGFSYVIKREYFYPQGIIEKKKLNLSLLLGFGVNF